VTGRIPRVRRNYAAFFGGVETTTLDPGPSAIGLAEFSLGLEYPEVAGVSVGLEYWITAEEHGLCTFAHGGVLSEHGSLGLASRFQDRPFWKG
jgi:hypothetical protein